MNDGAKEAEKILKRVESEGEVFGTSSFQKRAEAEAKPVDQKADLDAIDRLGTKIGRTLGRVAFVALAAYLLFTYVWK